MINLHFILFRLAGFASYESRPVSHNIPHQRGIISARFNHRVRKGFDKTYFPCAVPVTGRAFGVKCAAMTVGSEGALSSHFCDNGHLVKMGHSG